jgi:hypothetical protein
LGWELKAGTGTNCWKGWAGTGTAGRVGAGTDGGEWTGNGPGMDR